MKFGVLVFPGSHCDQDAVHAINTIAGQTTIPLWHASEDLEGCDAIILPGGFSYGDYLRTGAIASLAPILRPVKKFAANGGLVLGICNGFQILCEAGLLPGAFLRNTGGKYICKQLHLLTETADSPFTHLLAPQQVVQMPIGHADGNYTCDAATLAQLESQQRIAFRYATPAGQVTAAANPNGSLSGIAGILSEGRNVLGLMPHPERACDPLLGSIDGLKIFQGMATALTAQSPCGVPLSRD